MANEFPFKIRIAVLDAFTQPLATVSNKLNRIGKSARNTGAMLSFGLSTPIALVGLRALKTASKIEQMNTRFESLAGGADKAQKLVKELLQFSARTPFEISGVSEAAAQLLAAGFGVDSITGELKILGDIAAGAKRPLEEMVPLYTEIRLKGKAFTQDLRQFATRGVPVISVLAKQLGKTEAKIYDMAQQGKLKFPLIRQAMLSMTESGGLFFNQMDKQSRTLFGIWSNLLDIFNQAMGDFGRAFSEAIGLPGLVNRLIEGIGKLKVGFDALSPETKKFMAWTTIILAAGGPVLTALGFMAIGLGALLTPIGLLVVGVTAIGGAFLYASLQLSSFKDAAKGALVAIGGWILDYLLAPLRFFTRALENTISLLRLGGSGFAKGLHAFNNWSLGDSAAVQGWMAPDDATGPGGAPLGPWAQSGITTAAANRVQPSQSQVSIVFKNAPQGMRVTTESDPRTALSISQGLSMVTP